MIIRSSSLFQTPPGVHCRELIDLTQQPPKPVAADVPNDADINECLAVIPKYGTKPIDIIRCFCVSQRNNVYSEVLVNVAVDAYVGMY